MSTHVRLLLWLGIVTLLVLLLGGVSLGTIWKLRSEGRDVLAANYNSIAYMQRMLEAIDDHADTAAARRTLEAQLALQRDNVTEVGEAELTERLAVHLAGSLADLGNSERAREVRVDINALIDLNRAAIVHKSDQAEQRAETAVGWISAVGTACFLIVFTLFVSLPGRISEPIRKLTEGIDRIASGHYRERVQLPPSGEFGHMAERFNAMAAELERWQDSNLARIMEEKARAEAVIDSLQDASIGLDDQGRILFINRKASELLGLDEGVPPGTKVEEIAGRNDLLHRVVHDPSGAPFKVVVQGKENFFVAGSSPIQGSHGLHGSILSLRNITPFQERDQAKTHFLATISHELKTPLASTDIGLSLLERQMAAGTEGDRAGIVADLRKDHQRLVRIVSELLDLAQAETGNIRLRLTDLPLDQLVRDGLATVKAAAMAKGVTFEWTPTEKSATITADPDKGLWVVGNLLSNAIRFSPQGGTIHLSEMEKDDRVLFTVRDEGPGVDPRIRERLFQPFNTSSGPRQGTGLGLVICSEFMRAMGGTIRLLDDALPGAVFQIAFPKGW